MIVVWFIFSAGIDGPIRSSLCDLARVSNPPTGQILARICTPLNGAAAAHVRASVGPDSTIASEFNVTKDDMDSGTNVFERWFDTEGRRVLVVEEEDQHAGQHRLTHPAAGPRQLLQLPPLENMPDPLFCDPIYCSTPHPPSCLNYELPTFGPSGINVDSVTDNWSLWHEPNQWNYMVGKVDIAIFKKKDDPEWYKKCTHLDACGGITTSGRGAGEIVYDLPVEQMTAGLVVICVCCGKKIAESMVLNNENLVFKLNGRVLDKKGMDLYPADKCVRLLKGFEESGYQKEEKMLLSVGVLGGETEVKISHVLVL